MHPVRSSILFSRLILAWYDICMYIRVYMMPLNHGNSHVSQKLNHFHPSCIRKVMKIRQQERIPNTDILQWANRPTAGVMIMKVQLRYSDHVVWIPHYWFPNCLCSLHTSLLVPQERLLENCTMADTSVAGNGKETRAASLNHCSIDFSIKPGDKKPMKGRHHADWSMIALHALIAKVWDFKLSSPSLQHLPPFGQSITVRSGWKRGLSAIRKPIAKFLSRELNCSHPQPQR